MGAAFFIFFLLLLLGAGFVFLTLGTVLHILGILKKKRAFSVLASIFLPVGILTFAIPLVYFLFLRNGNAQLTDNYVDTGIMIEGGYQDGTFTVNGITYEPLDVDVVESALMREEPLYSWDTSSMGDRLFGYYDRGNYYPVKNAPGLDLICSGRTVQDKLWCPAEQLSQANTWYTDPANYQWYLVAFKDGYFTYTPMVPQPETAQIDALLSAKTVPPESVQFTVPLDVDITEYHLVSVSADGIVQRDWIDLSVHQGRLYFPESTASDGNVCTYTASPLPEALQDYFMQLLINSG